MTTPKPGKGPDSASGRMSLLVRLQVMKAEVDAVAQAGSCIALAFIEVHGAPTEMVSAAVEPPGPGGASCLKIDARLAALEELWPIAVEMMGYQDFERRLWLRGQFDASVCLKDGEGDGGGIEQIRLVRLSAMDLQSYLRRAIFAVLGAEIATPRRRSRVLEADVRRLMIHMCEVVRGASDAGSTQRGQVDRDWTASRAGFKLAVEGGGADLLDPGKRSPVRIPESRLRSAIGEALRRKLIAAEGTTKSRRYRVTEVGWRFVDASARLQRLQQMLIRRSMTLRQVVRVLGVGGRLAPVARG